VIKKNKYREEFGQMELDKLFIEINGYNNPAAICDKDVRIYKNLQKMNDVKDREQRNKKRGKFDYGDRK
jgi:hypothetical protein